jgi:hypothetical protein
MWKIGLTAMITAGICFLIGTATGLATWSGSNARTITVRPGDTIYLEGYDWTCDSTVRTPNFSCIAGRGRGPAPSPVVTIQPNLLQINSTTKVRIDSLSRPGQYLYDFPVKRVR